MQIFRVIGFALRYLPHLLIAIQLVEALQGAKTGEAKKDAVISAVLDLLNELGVEMNEDRKELLNDAVDLIVGILNKLGLFPKDDVPVPEQPPEPAAITSMRREETNRPNDARMNELEDLLSN